MNLKQLESLIRQMVLDGKGHIDVVDKDGKEISQVESIQTKTLGHSKCYDVVVVR
jgi:hypothetical protein